MHLRGVREGSDPRRCDAEGSLGDERRDVLEGDVVGLYDDIGPADPGLLCGLAELLLLP